MSQVCTFSIVKHNIEKKISAFVKVASSADTHDEKMQHHRDNTQSEGQKKHFVSFLNQSDIAT